MTRPSRTHRTRRARPSGRAATTSTPHDALFKHTFSQPQHAIELFRSVLPPAVVAHIDFDTLQMQPVSFIDDKLRARFSDLLFRVRLDRKPAYLYLLFEHQSNPERFMCRRLLRYVLDTWDLHLEKHKQARRLPVVIPIVKHHTRAGFAANWSTSLSSSPAMP